MGKQLPLGDFDDFLRWSGQPREWGPDDRWKVSFGGQVTDALSRLLDEHRDWGDARFRAEPAVLGDVPWLDDASLADRLAERPLRHRDEAAVRRAAAGADREPTGFARSRTAGKGFP
ncbi:MAG: hypothetical protein M3N53_08785 [Actinomycetota bacterium]|nr:hypothetical protein [Actinomycetota bacterium]